MNKQIFLELENSLKERKMASFQVLWLRLFTLILATVSRRIMKFIHSYEAHCFMRFIPVDFSLVTAQKHGLYARAAFFIDFLKSRGTGLEFIHRRDKSEAIFLIVDIHAI